MRVIGTLAPSGDTQAPTQPQNLQATAINRQRVDLSWTASTDDFGVAGYQIFRDGSPLDTTTATTYSDTTVTASTTYTYTVVAFDAAGNNSVPSASAQATTPANASPSWQAIPDQTLIVGDSLSLNLNNFCSDADADTIQYSEVAGAYPTGITRTGAVISGTPTTAGQAGTVTLDAFDGFVHVQTTLDYATYSADVTAPPVPTGLAATPGSTSIDLAWNASTDAAGGANEFVSGTQDYRVYRSTDGTNFSLRTTVAATAYSDTGLASNTTYHYKVSARDVELNESAQSASVNATTSVAQSITTLTLTSAAVTGTHPFMVGHGFKKGDVLTGQGIVSDTSGVTLRAVIKRRWNDGSVKHAVLVGSASFTQNVAKSIALKTGTAAGGTNLTSANIQTAAPTASVQCGAVGTVSLASLLASPFRTWISTPEMVECHYRSAVGADANLVAWFHVRLWADGRMWVRAFGENGFVGSSPSDQTFTVTVIIGGVTVFSASVTQNRWAGWDQTGWIGTDPQVTPAHNAAYLRATKLVANFWKTNPSTAKLNGLPQSYTPGDRGWYPANTSGTGQDGTFIGHFQNCEALYCTSAAPQAFRSVIACTRAIRAFSLFRKSSSTNRIPRPSDFPTTTYFGGNGSEQISIGALTWDVAHAPDLFVAYLITGDYYFYETLGHSAQSWYFLHRSAAGSGTARKWRNDFQNRAIAWGINTVGAFCAIAPNEAEAAADSSIVSDYQTWLGNLAVDWLAEINTAGQNQLGIPFSFSVDNQWTDGISGGVATWMQNYRVGSHGRVSDMEPLSDMSTWDKVRNVYYRWIIGTLGPTGSHNYYFAYASNYGVVVDPSASNPPAEFGPDETEFYDDWGSVFQATHGRVNNETTNTLQGGSSGQPGLAPNGYWGYLQPAICMAVDHGANGALAAYRRMTGATNWSTVENSGFDDTPIFGWTPRPAPATALATAANSLAAGQCIRLPITITAAQCVDDNAPIFKWGSSACWSPNGREVLFEGKRQDAAHRYYFLTFREVENTVDIARTPHNTSNTSGHGYDHNAIDPEQDEFFHKEWDDDAGPFVWNRATGTWSRLPAIGAAVGDACSLTYVPGLGLLTVDYVRIMRYDKRTNTWAQIVSLGGISQNHSVAEYNPISKVLVFGAGNNGDTLQQLDPFTLAITSVPTPPFNVGSSDTQGLLVADPAGPGFVINQKGTSNWRFWKPGDASWSTIAASTGNGATAQNGAPNLTNGAGDVGLARIAAPISTYGVMWFMEYVGGSDVARIWLYRHT